jgi:hypothetical protein
MRTLIDIPEEDLAKIKKITAEQGISRAEYVRRALKTSLGSEPQSDISQYFGLWAKTRAAEEMPEDGLAYEQRVRGEWDREWD